MEQERLSHIKKVLNEATSQGHWAYVPDGDNVLLAVTKFTEPHAIFEKEKRHVIATFSQDTLIGNVAFVGDARQYILELLSEVERLRTGFEDIAHHVTAPGEKENHETTVQEFKELAKRALGCVDQRNPL